MKKSIAVLGVVWLSMSALAAAAEISVVTPTTPIMKNMAVTVSLETERRKQAVEVCSHYITDLAADVVPVMPISLDGVVCGQTAAYWTGADSRGKTVFHVRPYDPTNWSVDRSSKDILIQ